MCVCVCILGQDDVYWGRMRYASLQKMLNVIQGGRQQLVSKEAKQQGEYLSLYKTLMTNG